MYQVGEEGAADGVGQGTKDTSDCLPLAAASSSPLVDGPGMHWRALHPPCDSGVLPWSSLCPAPSLVPPWCIAWWKACPVSWGVRIWCLGLPGVSASSCIAPTTWLGEQVLPAFLHKRLFNSPSCLILHFFSRFFKEPHSYLFIRMPKNFVASWVSLVILQLRLQGGWWMTFFHKVFVSMGQNRFDTWSWRCGGQNTGLENGSPGHYLCLQECCTFLELRFCILKKKKKNINGFELWNLISVLKTGNF